jgi:hypothetical protein
MMSKSHDYREEAAQRRQLVAKTKSLRESSQHRKIAEAYEALATSEDWLAGATSPVAESPA